MADKSTQGFWQNFIIPIVTLGVLIFFGVFYHAPWWMWVITVSIYLAGDAYEAYQLRKTGETTKAEYIAMVVAVVLMGLLAATQPLVFHH